MGKKLVVGQYIPGDSFIHKLDPRVKIFATVFFMVTVFMVNRILLYLPLFIYIFAVIKVCNIKFSTVIRGLKNLFIIILITTIFNLALTPGRVALDLGFIQITYEGIERSIFIILRLSLLVMGTTLLTLTTSPMDLTYGLEKIFSPLKKINFPVSEFALMISIALRFIPTLYDEAEKIMNAQKSRGADFESGNIFNRAKSMIPLLVPLFLSSMERADDLATAMEARCYRPGEYRTKLNDIAIGKIDIITMIGISFSFLLIIFLGKL